MGKIKRWNQDSRETGEEQRQPGRKKWPYVLILSILIIGGAAAGMLFLLPKKDNHQKQADKFIKILEKQNYNQLAGLLTAESIKESGYTEKEIVEKYDTIFKGLTITNIKASEIKLEKVKDSQNYDLNYTLSMDTPLGKIEKLDFGTTLIKEEETFRIAWNAQLIFPKMTNKDKVIMNTDSPERGSIRTINDQPLAINKRVNQLGIVPGKLGKDQERADNIKKICEKLDLTEKDIETKLSATWVNDDVFVPVKTLIDEDIDFSDLPGITVSDNVIVRYYPLKEAAAQLIGYTGNVTAEDIEKDASLNANSVIGKSGLEYRFDKELRGKDGGSIRIISPRNEEVAVLVSQEKENGSDIQTTIDSELQLAAYQAFNGLKGASVVINPQDGSLLTAVSSPSFNPNKMANGISQKDYDVYANDPNKPFLARYAQGYAPGSTFKTVTAAIGLDAGVTDSAKDRSISGLKWQKDASWGDYWVTRVSDVASINMETALIYSDNIYFAQESLDIGEVNYRKGLEKFIFGKKMTLPIDMTPAQISNEKSFGSEILLADTAYGQGELLINPIQQASIYSVFANDGKLAYPKILRDSEIKIDEAVITPNSANLVKEGMIKVVSNPSGTAHSLNREGVNLAAKTGTAEIKEKQDTKGVENSFLVTFNADKRDKLLVSIVENYQGGQSAVNINQELVKLIGN